jgi:hypothetical protein
MTTTDETREGQLTRRDVDRSLHRLDRFARLMDDQFELPIVGIKIGLDPLVGLLPGGGDWVTWAAGIYVFWEGLRLGVPRSILVTMAWHLTVDLLVGIVPLLGDAFDVWYRSHRRNVALLFDHFDADPHRIGDADLPDDHRVLPTWQRWTLGLGLTVLLAGIAAIPLVVTWWLLAG